MARNLQALLPLALEYGPGRIAFCTDDRDPEDIADDGHINGMVREAVAAGRPAGGCARSWPRCSAAQWHGLDRHGAIAPGYQADLLLLPDLEGFVPDLVLKRGRPIVARAVDRPCPTGSVRPCGSQPVIGRSDSRSPLREGRSARSG